MVADEWNASVDLSLDLGSPALARNVTRLLLAGWGLTDPGWLDQAAVVVAELVSNAVPGSTRHPPPAGRCGRARGLGHRRGGPEGFRQCHGVAGSSLRTVGGGHVSGG